MAERKGTWHAPRVSGDGVRRLGPQDAGELLTLQRAAYVTEAQLYDDPHIAPLVQTLDELSSELADPAVLALGLYEGARLVASIRLQVDGERGEVGSIRRLVVAPDRQGHGLGGQVLAALEDRLPETVRTLRLFTGQHSEGNLRLYARHGYREDRREPTGHLVLVHLSKPVRRA